MSRMFTFNGKRMITWNPFTGCNFHCTYCWARKLAESKLKKSYPNGFIPTTRPDRFNRRFKPDDFVFVCDMADISFAPPPVLNTISAHAYQYPDTNFLICTKDPETTYKYLPFHKSNIYLGTTLESNQDFGLTKAPSPYKRYTAMQSLNHPHKFISIEPIMDFNFYIFTNWIIIIHPEIIEVGADNYHNNLPEPTSNKVNALLTELKRICPTVIEKDGLERLK